MKRKARLKAKTGLRPGKPMRPRSKKRRQSDAAYRDLLPLEGVKCYDPDCPKQATSRHHLYPQRGYPYLTTEILNVIPGCKHHHDQWDSRKVECRKMVRKLEPLRMTQLDKLRIAGSKVGW